jgi:hypothetical protein
MRDQDEARRRYDERRRALAEKGLIHTNVDTTM